MNITRLIPYLLNKITKVENSVGNIDFSSLQEKNEKNQINGYLGLNDRGKIDSITRLGVNNKFGYTIDFTLFSLISSASTFNATVFTGAGSYSNNGGINTPKLISGNNTQFFLPILQLNSGLAGYVSASMGVYPINLKSPYSIYSEQVITVQRNTTKSFKIVISCGVGTISSNTGSFSASTNSLIFTFDPTINGGNWQVGKVINGFPTVFSTNTTLPNENVQSLAVIYNRLTEVAQFYIDGVLVYELADVNLPTTTTFTNTMAMSTNDATETYVRRLSPIREVFEVSLA